jgi:hypothetical protein
MLKSIDEDLITVHGRTALGLLAAEHVAPLLVAHPPVRSDVDKCLRADWSWMESRVPDPGRLYWDHLPRLMEHDSRLPADPALPALHCALYAHMYAVWSAEGVTNLEQPGTVLSIGNDIADVDESYLTQCLDAAVRISPQPEQTTAWLNELIAYLEIHQRKTPTDLIGPRLHRADFQVPVFVRRPSA